MPWAVVFLVVVFVGVIASSIVFRRRASARNATAWLRARCGGNVSLMSACVLLGGGSRRIGAVALTQDAIVWRSQRFDRSMTGDIPLARVVLTIWCDAVRGSHPAIRWRVPARILTLVDAEGRETHFMFDRIESELWEKVLEARLSDKVEGLEHGAGDEPPVSKDVENI